MSNQLEQTITPQELRQVLLAELDVTKQVITELSDEELEAIAGAGEGNDQGMSTGEKVGIAAGAVGGVGVIGTGATVYAVHRVKNSVAGKVITTGVGLGKKYLFKGAK